MTARTLAGLFGVIVALGSQAVAQGPAPRAAATQDPQREPFARFRALDVVSKAVVLREIERRLRRDPDPTVQNVFAWAQRRGLSKAEPPTAHDPKRWAPGAAPRRTMIRAATKEHDALRATIKQLFLLPDLRKGVHYDWARGAVVQREPGLGFDAIFANCLDGYPPGSDLALANVLATLDDDPGQRPVAAYLGHLYADLDARVFEGVTLYEGWYSQAILDVPDVDAIPFARLILKTDAYVSPIPAGPERAALYQQIRDAAFAHRKYRTLREAVAATFLRAEPILDPTYANLVPRAHTLWGAVADDPRAAADRLRTTSDRAQFIEAMGNAMADPVTSAARDRRVRDLTSLVGKVRSLALWALDRQAR